MKIWIVGLGKCGTSILTYKIAQSMLKPNVFFEISGLNGMNDIDAHKRICLSDNVVVKNIFYPKALNKIKKIACLYDKKIWIIRDPRDRVLSAFFYEWYHNPQKKIEDFERVLNLVKQKEQNPSGLSFFELYKASKSINDLSNEIRIYDGLMVNLHKLDSSWFIIKYEDLINQNDMEINQYLGFKIKKNVVLPQKFKRIARTKTFGNWRQWFTPEDVSYFKKVYNPYLEVMGYDKEDWNLVASEKLDSKTSSEYMKQLFYTN